VVETVENIMTKVVTCATPDYSLTELEKVMDKQNIRCLPIISDDGSCIGVVSPIDIVHWLELQKAMGAAQAKDILTRPCNHGRAAAFSDKCHRVNGVEKYPSLDCRKRG